MFRYKICLLAMGLLSSTIWGQALGIMIPQKQIHWRNSVGNFYSPFDKRGFYYKAFIEINVPSNMTGAFFIGFELKNNDIKRKLVHESSQVLTYFLTTKTNSNQYLLDWPMISSPENTISFSLKGNNPPIMRIPIYIWIDPGQAVSAHTFSGDITMTVYKGAYNQGGQPEKVSSGLLSLVVKVSDDIQISLGNDQFNRLSEFKVAFEKLTEGEAIIYDAFVNSFDSYILTLKSQGKGRLSHHLDQVKTSISYQVSIDNQVLIFDEFGNANKVIEKNGRAEKSHHKIKIILGKASHAFKGEYSDRITLRATPKN